MITAIKRASGSGNSQKPTPHTKRVAKPIIDFTAKSSKKTVVGFRKITDGKDDDYIFIHGRVAQTLICLHQAGSKGITAAEMSSWALRLSAYICELRHEYGLHIRRDNELHDGGWHGRYTLESPIQIKIPDSKG